MSDLIVTDSTIPAELREEIARAADYSRLQHAGATIEAYERDWEIFTAWCAERELQPMPAAPQVIATFLASEAERGMKPSTVGRRLAAVRYIHAAEDHEIPMTGALKAVLAGIRRSHGTAPDKKAAATDDIVRRMADACTLDLTGKRNRAIILLGFATALRRAELAALELSDIAAHPEGVLVTLRRSKTDQEGRGQQVAVPRMEDARYCAVAALETWLTAARIEEGPLFRRFYRNGAIGKRALSSRAVANLIKELAAAIGEDPADYSGHSLRAGYATSAARQGHDALRIAQQTRHSRLDSVQGYVREANAFADHPLFDLLRVPDKG